MQVRLDNECNLSYKSRLSLRKKVVFDSGVISRMANILNLEHQDVYKHTREMNVQQFEFFRAMVEKYNGKYYYSEEKENPYKLFEVVKNFPKPNKVHMRILNSVSAPFENLVNILKLATEKKDVDFVSSFERKIFGSSEPKVDFVSDILMSPYKKEYVENLDKYLSYIHLNKENPNAIKELDRMIESGTYKQATYDNTIGINRIKRNMLNEILSEKDLETFYSKEGEDFINLFSDNYQTQVKFSENDRVNILKMYQTSNSENIEIRSRIMNRFRECAYDLNNYSEEIDAMRALFEKIDSDKDAFKFINKYSSELRNIRTIQELNNILEIVPAEKACIFHKNLNRIIQITKPGAERNRALAEELTNLSYENEISKQMAYTQNNEIKYGYKKPESKFHKFLVKLENCINILKYSFVCKHEKKTVLIAEPEVINVIKEEEKRQPVYAAIAELKNKNTEVQNLAKEYINQALHPNIVAEQESIYVNKATKMRLKMLPEILKSIKETRSIDKKVGIKSKITNRDAVDLYTRINGQNRKLVEYMLKKRNVDGTRMFNIQNIIDTLTSANRKVILERLNRAEAKAYYEHLYNAKIEQYGELNRR